MRGGSFEKKIKEQLKGARKIVVMAVGDELDSHDCLGILAGKRMSALRLKRVEVLLTGQMPENYTSIVRRRNPSHVVLIDAAEMGRPIGDVEIIHPGRISATRVSTHAIPLSLLMSYLETEMRVKVTLIGIQPVHNRHVSVEEQPPEVMRGIERIAAALRTAVSQ